MCQREWVGDSRLARQSAAAEGVLLAPCCLESNFLLGCCICPLQFLCCNRVAFGSRPAPGSMQGLDVLLVCGSKPWGSRGFWRLGICAV